MRGSGLTLSALERLALPRLVLALNRLDPIISRSRFQVFGPDRVESPEGIPPTGALRTVCEGLPTPLLNQPDHTIFLQESTFVPPEDG